MASDPVIIDDGGSTRIRYLLPTGIGAMDSLLDVGPLPEGSPAPGSPGSQHTFSKTEHTLFTELKIVFISPDTATPTAIQVAGGAKPPLVPGDKIVIVSGPLAVQVDIDSPLGSGNSVLTSFGSLTSGQPLVAAKQQHKRRHYLVGAAPPVSSVTVTLSGVTSTPFEAAKTPSSYTQVHIK